MGSKFVRTALAVMVAPLLAVPAANAQSEAFKIGKSLEIQNNILKGLSLQFVDTIDIEQLTITGINAMLGSLDPYTEFIPEEAEQDIELLTTATYGGIGSIIKKVDSIGVVITQPYLNSPASKSGLEPGDVILKINGEDVTPFKADECSSRMKGVPGTTVNFLVKKARSGELKEYSIVRERIHIPDVSYSGIIGGNTGYIKIDGFTVDGSKDVKDALVSLKEKGAEKIMLDLRGNGGGLMDEAIKIVSLFVPKGTMVVSQRGRDRKSVIEYRTQEEPVDTLIPLMVLVNSGSASSSEIVAGALQDLDRAVIAGTRTYGKGLIQVIRPVGYGATVKFTVGKYYTPSGRCVQAIDYSHRNSDGSVGAVPDSLKKPFKTRLGRTVYDGGGITPDTVITQEVYSRTALSLTVNDIFGDYALKFYSMNDTIQPPALFSLSDAQYDDFVEYASKREFDSRSAAQVQMEKLIEAAKGEGLYEYNKEEFEALNSKLTMDKRQILNVKKDEFKPLLEEEISNKYYFTPGRVESIIRNDTQLHKALEAF